MQQDLRYSMVSVIPLLLYCMETEAVADIKRAGLPVQGPVSDSGWDMGGVGLKLRPCSAPVGGWER